MNCVICSVELQPEAHEGIDLIACPAGHGKWVEFTKLRLIVDTQTEPRSDAEREAAIEAGVPASAPDIDTQGVRACPVCQVSLEKVNYDETSSIMIDTCVDHGVWLDDNELPRIEAWIEANREELAPIRDKIRAELAENDAEIEAALKAGEGKGPLGMLWSTMHYYRHAGEL